MSEFIPIWIIGAPVAALVVLSFAFKGQSAMGGAIPREGPRTVHRAIDPSAPLFDPMVPNAPRRFF